MTTSNLQWIKVITIFPIRQAYLLAQFSQLMKSSLFKFYFQDTALAASAIVQQTSQDDRAAVNDLGRQNQQDKLHF